MVRFKGEETGILRGSYGNGMERIIVRCMGGKGGVVSRDCNRVRWG